MRAYTVLIAQLIDNGVQLRLTAATPNCTRNKGFVAGFLDMPGSLGLG